MSKALKCDRCGKYYEKNVMFKTTGVIHGGILGGITVVDKSGKFDEHFDLCDDCLKDLWLWKSRPEFEDRWVPVSVGCPDNEREVLVTIKRTETGEARYVVDKARYIRDEYTDKAVWKNDEYGAIGVSNAKYMAVTAWMEMPKPYKEDTQDE